VCDGRGGTNFLPRPGGPPGGGDKPRTRIWTGAVKTAAKPCRKPPSAGGGRSKISPGPGPGGLRLGQSAVAGQIPRVGGRTSAEQGLTAFFWGQFRGTPPRKALRKKAVKRQGGGCPVPTADFFPWAQGRGRRQQPPTVWGIRLKTRRPDPSLWKLFGSPPRPWC